MATVLLIAVCLPLGVALTLPGNRAAVRRYSLLATLLVLGLAVALVASFPAAGTAGGEAFAVADVAWTGSSGMAAGIKLSLGLDGLSLWLFALTALLMVLAVAVSWEAITQQASLYYRLLLLLETGMLGVFAARDIILFYICFEFTLIPLFFMIGIWGSEQRRHAAVKFFLFTFAGSVLTFLGLLAVVLCDYYQGPPHPMTFSIPELTARLAAVPIDPTLQRWIFLALFAGFAVKVPLFPLHTWLPLAHVEAPAAGSILLAGVLLKIGTYGFLRFSLPLLPAATAAAMPWLLWLSVAGIIYGALVALAQSDLKRLIAYSSVSHLAFCMLGIFALNRLATQGAVLQMVNHGLSTGGLFAIVGMLYERYHTRQIADLGGLARQTPVLAFFMVLLTFSSIGLPGLNGFVGEFLILLGMFQRGWAESPVAWAAHYRAISVLALGGVVLSAWYMLQLVERVFFGPPRWPKHGPVAADVHDLTAREVLALAPLAALIFWIGLQPQFFLDRIGPTIDSLTARATQAAYEGPTPIAAGQRPAHPPVYRPPVYSPAAKY